MIRKILLVVFIGLILICCVLAKVSVLRLLNFKETLPENVPSTPTLYVCSHDHKNHTGPEDIFATINFARYLTQRTLLGVSIIVHPILKQKLCKVLTFYQAVCKVLGFDVVLLWNVGKRERDAVRALKAGRNVIALMQHDAADEKDNSYEKVRKPKPSSIRRILSETNVHLFLVRFYLAGRVGPLTVRNWCATKRVVYFDKTFDSTGVVDLSDEDADKLVRAAMFTCSSAHEEELLRIHESTGALGRQLAA